MTGPPQSRRERGKSTRGSPQSKTRRARLRAKHWWTWTLQFWRSSRVRVVHCATLFASTGTPWHRRPKSQARSLLVDAKK
eukprot:213430-Rhodomonas_salina.2